MHQLRISHTLGGSKSLISKLEGALSILVVWGAWFGGPLTPALLLVLLWLRCWLAAVVLFVCMAYPFVWKVKESPAFCRFYLKAAGWFVNGATLWIEDETLRSVLSQSKPQMFCYHPHGVLAFGFSLNGAVRAKTKDPTSYVPKQWKNMDCNVSGIQAPVLFNLPFVRMILNLWGCCVPATKKGMFSLFEKKIPFGILPGGSEEIVIHKFGEERVYIKHRAGFIKYGLQHGSQVFVAYTFGESDLYTSVSCLEPLLFWLVQSYGFVIPIFCGKWWCPLLPRDDIDINTVLGEAISLPKIEQPSKAEVEKWHAVYVGRLTSLFNRHKERFGYADRELVIR